MDSPDQDRAKHEIGRLREALAAETERCIELQKELERANAEFEEFVSVAAHNLRESLRDVISFSQLIDETQAGRLGPDTTGFLEHIQDGAARMQSLLAAVVDYWATGTGGAPAYRTDLEAVLRQALLATDKRIAEGGGTVTHDPLPEVMGDFRTLANVLHHLIANAIEYCGVPDPRVHVSSMQGDREWVISVRDNGPGVDPAFQKRIFGAFKRLHGREYPGEGLGLAYCRKVIQGQGGRIWVESGPGSGSVFYFTLPAAG